MEFTEINIGGMKRNYYYNYMELSNQLTDHLELDVKMKEVANNCFTSSTNLANLTILQQHEVYRLFEQIKFKDIIDQGFWSLGGGLNHYKLSLGEIKLSLLELLSNCSDERDRLILKEIFLFLNILDDRSFYQLIALRQLINCPSEIFDEKINRIKRDVFEL
ncbi:hypothetical protein ACFRAE_16980 [Sphingobacterium sp. HJSM2_6]|uniref:hypothetical protein n=1 Tax=Sphingobacterium sp. HJSM2_6 TaxID=3366264 RepID=UPI003BD27357